MRTDGPDKTTDPARTGASARRLDMVQEIRARRQVAQVINRELTSKSVVVSQHSFAIVSSKSDTRLLTTDMGPCYPIVIQGTKPDGEILTMLCHADDSTDITKLKENFVKKQEYIPRTSQ